MLSTTTPAGNSDRDGRSNSLSVIAQRYELSSLVPLLTSSRSAFSQQEVSLAVIGRFKAGKSSFPNHFTSRSILPVGVVPVTAVVTEIRFGPTEKAAVHFMDRRVDELAVQSIGQYVRARESGELQVSQAHYCGTRRSGTLPRPRRHAEPRKRTPSRYRGAEMATECRTGSVPAIRKGVDGIRALRDDIADRQDGRRV